MDGSAGDPIGRGGGLGRDAAPAAPESVEHARQLRQQVKDDLRQCHADIRAARGFKGAMERRAELIARSNRLSAVCGWYLRWISAQQGDGVTSSTAALVAELLAIAERLAASGAASSPEDDEARRQARMYIGGDLCSWSPRRILTAALDFADRAENVSLVFLTDAEHEACDRAAEFLIHGGTSLLGRASSGREGA